MKRLLITGMAVCALASCTKDKNQVHVNEPGATDLSELVIPQEFNWSSSKKGNTHVNLQHNSKYSTEGQEVWLVDAAGHRLDRSIVSHDQASFYISMPQTGEEIYLYYPNTGDRKVLEQPGQVSMKLHFDYKEDMDQIIANAGWKKFKKSATSASSVTALNKLGNADFEINNFNFYFFQPGIVDDGNWYTMDNNFTWDTKNGSKVIRAKRKRTNYMFQAVSVTPGDSFAYRADAEGQASTLILWYQANQVMHFAQNCYVRSGATITGSGVVPPNAAYAVVFSVTEDHGWTDNISFGTEPAIIDADGDGIADSNDDFPNDPARAFRSNFPSSGKQTLVFEDLWPVQGDYDFNDMVVSNNIRYSRDANGHLVDAEVTISLDAAGAGIKSGLAILLLDGSGQPFSANIISGVSGDASLDPDNTNGIIVFNNFVDVQTTRYTNTGMADSWSTPDTVSFTISFNNSAGSANILPDLYIFRSNERGHEVHLSGFSGSAIADANYFNTNDDYNGTYKTANGLPWVLEVITPNGVSFNHPRERTDILVAYPGFQAWAESLGGVSTDWFLAPRDTSVIDVKIL